MKKITSIIAIVMIAFTTNAVAQSSATSTAATTSATVIKPISITKDVNMNFGNLVATVAGGNVVLPTTAVRTSTNGAILAGPTGTVAAASFTVNGELNYTYAITLPSSSFTVSNGAATPITMSVGTFVSSPSGTGTLSASGTQTLLVGATITMIANQASAAYTNTTGLVVTVNYN